MSMSYAQLHVKKRNLEQRKDTCRNRVMNKEHHSTNSSNTKQKQDICKMIDVENNVSSLENKSCPKSLVNAGRVKEEVRDQSMELQRPKGSAKEDAKDCGGMMKTPLLTTNDLQTSAFMSHLKTILSALPTRHPPNAKSTLLNLIRPESSLTY